MIDPKLSNLIKNEVKFPTLPAIASEILQAVSKDDAALIELSSIISLAPALSVKILRVANSSLFGCNQEVTDIKRAVSILGTNTAKSIALSFVITANLSKQQDVAYSLDQFWRHSVTAAVAAELLSQKLQRDIPDIFLVALLQDLGALMILLTKGREYKEVLDELSDNPTDLCHQEHEQYGFDHQQVASLLFYHWNFPENLFTPVLYHHHPDHAPEEFKGKVEVLFWADQLAEIYTGKKVAEKARQVQSALMAAYGMNEAESLELLDEVAEKSREIITLFDIDPLDMQPFSQVLQQANQDLGRLNLSKAQLFLELHEAKEQNQRLIQKLQDAKNRLTEMVSHDSLTSVYNHRYFQEALEAELARAIRYRSSVSLVLFDIDYFKLVNDNYGYLVGDMVLMNIAKAIISTVRTNDVVARFGGDEFAIILPSTNREGARTFAEHLRSCVEGIATSVEGKWVTATISIGTATAVPSEQQIQKDQLIGAADRALYQAKNAGRNQVVLAEG